MVTPLAHRFWPKVRVADGCWEWQGTVDETVGYGRISTGGRNGSVLGAHRVAYLLAKGGLPTGMVLHHTCENRLCVRPDHLKPLTRAEHMEHHREEITGKGEAHAISKLTEREVLEMRRLYDVGDTTYKDVGKKFGLGTSHARRVIIGELWGHVK